jgi:hypothetical protein
MRKGFWRGNADLEVIRDKKYHKLDLMELACEDGRWEEIYRDRVPRQFLILVVTKLPVPQKRC